MSSMLPILLIGGIVLIALNFFKGPSVKKKKQTTVIKRDVTPSSREKYYDFEFKIASDRDDQEPIEIETKAFYVLLSNVGGRIKKFYIKSHGGLQLPEAVVRESKDKIAIRKKALEVTKYNGMEFQPHIYWRKDTGQYWQIKNPPLNHGLFTLDGIYSDNKNKIQEILFRLPVRFKGHRLELIKAFYFYNDEHFFRQITVLRNLEKKDFVLNGDLYFKTFGDMGLLGEESSARTPSTRFYYYNGKLVQRTIGGGGGGCSGAMFCGSNGNEEPIGKKDALEFVGSTSRYFFSYNRFARSPANPLHSPDGIIIVDRPDPTGRETATSVFADLKLSPMAQEPLLFSPLNRVEKNVQIRNITAGSSRADILKIQNRRYDALIIDNQIYFGVRSDESHSFKNEKMMAEEFGIQEPDKNARDALFSSGYFSYFSKIKDAIVWLMRIVYGYVGNYGWTIIIIATGIKLLTFPLTQMQVKSMRKMSALKPDMDRINKQYKSEPKEKQKKVMELYKKHNVNPAKGCLPLIIQMPIFVALFSAFSESIELWQSPFIFWMKDLSSPDTVYIFENLVFVENFHLNILPLLMVASQMLYQRFTTMTSDPQQKMLMYIMPLLFTFMFWSMPSGVTLYWTIQNLLHIAWQILANRFSKDDTAIVKVK